MFCDVFCWDPINRLWDFRQWIFLPGGGEQVLPTESDAQEMESEDDNDSNESESEDYNDSNESESEDGGDIN